MMLEFVASMCEDTFFVYYHSLIIITSVMNFFQILIQILCEVYKMIENIVPSNTWRETYLQKCNCYINKLLQK